MRPFYTILVTIIPLIKEHNFYGIIVKIMSLVSMREFYAIILPHISLVKCTTFCGTNVGDRTDVFTSHILPSNLCNKFQFHAIKYG